MRTSSLPGGLPPRRGDPTGFANLIGVRVGMLGVADTLHSRLDRIEKELARVKKTLAA